MARRGSTTLDELFERPYRPGVTFGPRISGLRRWGMLLVLALLVGVIITYWILTDTRRVTAMAESYLARLTGAKVHVQGATLSIFEGLRLEKVTLHADADPARHPDSLVFKARTFLVKYNPQSILSGRLEATQIIALEPQVFLCENLDAASATTQPASGPRRWNWQRMVRQKETATTQAAPGPRLKLPEVLLRNAQIHYSRIKDGQLLHEKGMMEIEASFRPTEDDSAISFSLQSRGEEFGVGPVVKGTYTQDTRAIAASLDNFRFGKDIEVMLPKEVRDWWTQHGLSGTLDIPTFYMKPSRDGKEPNKFRIETALKNVTLKILPEEWLSAEEEFRLATMRRSMEFMKASGLDHSGFVSHLYNQFNPSPIEFDKVAGRFVFTEVGVEVDRVGGWVEGNPFTVNGEAQGYSPLAAARFKIEGHGIRIPARPRYLNSMPPQVRELYDDLKPEGDGSLVLEIVRPSAGDKPLVRGQVDVHDGRFKFDEFPYPIRNVKGLITFGWDDKTQMNRVDIHYLRGWGMEGGPNQDRYVDVRGFVAPLGRGPAEYDFVVSTKNITSEPEVMSALPKPIRDALKVFDFPGKGLFPTFKGSFVCHVHRDASIGAKWRHTVDIDLEDAAGQFVFFPYPVDRMKGKLRATDEHVQIQKVTARKGDATLEVSGIVDYGPKGEPVEPDLKIVAKNLPIDKDLLRAIKPDQRQWLEKLGVGGKLTVEGIVKRDPAYIPKSKRKPGQTVRDEDGVTYDFHLRLREGVLWPVDGTFALSNVHADLRLTPTQLLITESTGKRGDGTVSADGLIAWPAGEPKLTINARAKNILLDNALYKFLPPAWREGWDGTRPEGTIDVDLTYNSGIETSKTAVASIDPVAGATTQPFSATIRPNKLSVNPKIFPTRMENVKGEIVIRPNLIELKDLTAQRPNKGGSVVLSGVVTPTQTPAPAPAKPGQPEADQGSSTWSVKVSGKDLVPDDELRTALPPAVAKLLESLSLQGKFSTDFTKLNYVPPTTPTSDDAQIDFAGTITLAGNSLDVGVPLTAARGSVAIDGASRNGKLAGLTGSIDLDTVNLSGREIKAVKAQLFKPASEDALRIGKITGEIARGKLDGQVDLVYPDVGPSRFGLKLVLHQADVQTLVGDAEKDIKGHVTASLDLEGSWGEAGSRRGRGDVSVSGKEMYRIPLVLGLLQITNLSLPISSPFSEAAARYTVEGEKVNFGHIELRASNVLMSGHGYLDFGRKHVDMTFRTDNPNAWKIPFLHELFQGARQELLQIRVSGTIQEPKVKGNMMSTFSTTIDEVFKGGERGGKKK